MPTPSAQPIFSYIVDCRNPGTHVYHLTLTIVGLTSGQHILALPVWTPGAYEVRDFAAHVFDLRLAAGPVPLPAHHQSKNQWIFETTADMAEVTVQYQVYAFQLGVASSHLDQSHAYFNGAQLFFLVDDYRDAAWDVVIQAPPEWRVATGLEPVANHPYHYRAADYDILIDSPVEIGTHRAYTFMVDHKRHEIAIWGHGNEDPDVLVADTEAIVKAQRDLFGGLPYDHYTFILHLSDRATGGLEHLNSTTCGTERFAYRPRKKYRRVLQLIAHEFFHLWNVKRIHPEMLGPFDYQREVYTHLLWAMEGFTDYFGDLSLRYAERFTPQEYLKTLADRIKLYEKLPGRLIQSLSESSFDTWIKLYKPDSDSPNRTISYYLKGDLVGMCLDLAIRHHTANQGSLAEVLRRLYDRYGSRGIGFPESVYQETVEEVAGCSFEDFFRHYIDGTDPVPFEQFLNYAGLTLERTYKNTAAETNDGDPGQRTLDAPLPWLGIDTEVKNGHELTVKVSYTNGPAAERLNPGDRLAALNGYEITTDASLNERISLDHAIGEVVEVAFFRRGLLTSATVTLAAAPPNTVKIVPVKDATETQKSCYQAWLRADWQAAEPLPDPSEK